MTTRDRTADDLAHAQFKADFNKLFGVKPQLRKRGANKEDQRRRNIERAFPTPELRREYESADEAGKTVMLLEKMPEAMVEPQRLEKRAALAKIAADSREMRAQLDAYKGEIEKIDRDFSEIKKRAEEARSRSFHVRPFALDPNDPAALEIVGEALRRNPNLLDKINRPN
ncbi:MAG: hypothetical protein KGM15_12000 [Pseudomonadota bacterium]|nr:hypothetical protein [Pseudomonadota bacterium]